MTSQHSEHDVRPGWAGRAATTFALRSRSGATGAGSSLSPQTNLPATALAMPLRPPSSPGWPCTPCPREAAGEGGTYLLGPRCRPASPGWGGSSATHKWEGGQSWSCTPAGPFPWGTRGTRCHRWPPARVPGLQRAAEAAAAPGQPWPLQQHCHHSPFFPILTQFRPPAMRVYLQA